MVSLAPLRADACHHTCCAEQAGLVGKGRAACTRLGRWELLLATRSMLKRGTICWNSRFAR